MTTEQRKEENELIAKFMYGDNCLTYAVGVLSISIPTGVNSGTIVPLPNYDTSWDWLMPVVEKIGKIMNEFEKKPFLEMDEAREMLMTLGECLCHVEIENAYKAVVEFIEWYNSQAEYKR